MGVRRSSCCFSPSFGSCSCFMSHGCSSFTIMKRRYSTAQAAPACYLMSSLSQYLSSLILITNRLHLLPSLTSLLSVTPSLFTYPPSLWPDWLTETFSLGSITVSRTPSRSLYWVWIIMPGINALLVSSHRPNSQAVPLISSLRSSHNNFGGSLRATYSPPPESTLTHTPPPLDPGIFHLSKSTYYGTENYQHSSPHSHTTASLSLKYTAYPWCHWSCPWKWGTILLSIFTSSSSWWASSRGFSGYLSKRGHWVVTCSRRSRRGCWGVLGSRARCISMQGGLLRLSWGLWISKWIRTRSRIVWTWSLWDYYGPWTRITSYSQSVSLLIGVFASWLRSIACFLEVITRTWRTHLGLIAHTCSTEYTLRSTPAWHLRAFHSQLFPSPCKSLPCTNFAHP